MGNADQTGAAPARMAAPRLEGAIVKTAAHPQAMALGVKTNERQDDEVEMTYLDEMLPACAWLGDPKAV